jgi:hypothetical protein
MSACPAGLAVLSIQQLAQRTSRRGNGGLARAATRSVIAFLQLDMVVSVVRVRCMASSLTLTPYRGAMPALCGSLLPFLGDMLSDHAHLLIEQTISELNPYLYRLTTQSSNEHVFRRAIKFAISHFYLCELNRCK